MTIMDLVTVLLVFGGIGYILFARLHKKNPKSIEVIKGFIPNKLSNKMDAIKQPTEKLEQIWPEKRSMM